MKNPLYKRLPREFKEELGKYIAVFIFMVATIGFISGFLVADGSMIKAYNDSFDKYNIENGNFELTDKASQELINTVEDNAAQIFENFYVEKGSGENIIRIYKNRNEVDKVCIMKGSLPSDDSEIAIDRMYAQNNKISVGDKIDVGNSKMTISGLVALSDYSALFSDNTDTMFDSIKFAVAIVSDSEFEKLSDGKIYYNYSWKYGTEPDDEIEEKEMSDKFMQAIAEKGTLVSYVPRYSNQAINFTGNDMGSDKSMMLVLLYILIAILAFVFAVTISNTIAKEATVIGTLRASGYSRGEMLKHYISMPVLVTLIAAIIGNILGYTIFKNICVSMYYNSYSLVKYKTIWNAEAFVLTTVIPMVIMLIINVGVIYARLRISPLRFIRNDLGSRKRKKARKLPSVSFLSRFRLRIIGQNLTGYVTLFVGIAFANLLLLFGMMVSPLLTHFQKEILDNMIAEYQYVLKAPAETTNKDAEAYCVASLNTTSKMFESEEINIYGISDNSRYVSTDVSDGIFISDTYADKYDLEKGDSITLKEKFSDKTYEFKIDGIYKYPAALSVFMSCDEFRKVFGLDEGYFNGYLSDTEITDIPENMIMTTITEDDLTKLSRQMNVSMGEMFKLVNIFAIVLFALLIYLLTKLIIEKNTTSISMVKILGYRNSEIARLYLLATTIAVVVSALLSLGIADIIISLIYKSIMSAFSGWIMLYIKPEIYPEMFVMNICVYVIVAILQYRKIGKIPMDQALKNVE